MLRSVAKRRGLLLAAAVSHDIKDVKVLLTSEPYPTTRAG